MSVSSTARRGLIAGLALALAMLGGCTSDDDGAPADEAALERVLGATEATRDAGTARMEQTMTMVFPEGGSPGVAGGSIEVDSSGFLDLRGRRGRLSVTTEGSGLAGADALAGDMEMILDGEAMYMRSPFFQQLAPNHEPWLRVSFQELGLRGMAQLGQQDPLSFVEALRGVYGDVEEVGREEVRGESTTHFKATIDIGKLVSELPEGARATVAGSFEGLGIEQMPVDVWLDEEGRLRRIASDVELTGDATNGGRMEMSMELYEFGVAFEIEVPPPDEVADFEDVFGASGG